MFTFTDQADAAAHSSDVTFVSVYHDKSLQTGVCKHGMVEFLRNSGIYQPHRDVSIDLHGHIFSQGDLKVRVGCLTVNFPKFLLVQVYYEPSVFIRENNFDWQQAQVDELIKFSLRIDNV